jgi:hypothetical protein
MIYLVKYNIFIKNYDIFVENYNIFPEKYISEKFKNTQTIS